MSERLPSQLAQICPANTAVNVAATKPAKEKWILTSIVVCNTDSSTRTFSIYVDTNGSVGNATTALYSNASVAANTTTLIDFGTFGLPIDKASTTGSVSVQASAANVVCFTINGFQH